MRLGVVANIARPEHAGQTTFRIAAAACNRGHEVWVMGTGGFAYDPDGAVRARARTVPPGGRRSVESYLGALGGAEARWIRVDRLDVLMLRSNPAMQSVWAQLAGINFGRIARQCRVIVLNDPDGLARATSKLYLQAFPESVRPVTLVTRSRPRIMRLARRLGTIVIKPLTGSGGRGVFIVRPQDGVNLESMVRAVSRDGYVVAQEYLPAAAEGDTRMFLMNGRPLRYRGRYAAFRRIRSGGDLRSNVQAGGRLRRAVVDETMLGLAEAVRPQLVADGMFLVGLDIAGDKLLEINVFSPGGLGSARLFEKVDFTAAVIDALEHKVQCRRERHAWTNVELATL